VTDDSPVHLLTCSLLPLRLLRLPRQQIPQQQATLPGRKRDRFFEETDADLAERLSVIANAPRTLVGQLAREDEILIAGPLLRRSPVIDERALIEIARIKGQGHLLAMSERPTLSPDLTDVIVRRGDRDTVRRAAGNAGALFSQAGYSTLIKRANQDGVLTLTVGQRDDLSDPQLKDLLAGSIDIIRRRLFEVVKPGRQAAIKQAMSEISGVLEIVESRRDFAPAQSPVHGDENSETQRENDGDDFCRHRRTPAHGHEPDERRKNQKKRHEPEHTDHTPTSPDFGERSAQSRGAIAINLGDLRGASGRRGNPLLFSQFSASDHHSKNSIRTLCDHYSASYVGINSMLRNSVARHSA